MPSQNDIRQNVTTQLLEALESGVTPWRRPWASDKNAGQSANVVSGKPYRGVNPLLLDMAMMKHNLQSRYWGTFQQWKQLGATVKPRPVGVAPGKWGTQIVFTAPVSKKSKDGDETDERFWILKTYTVFNVDQTVGESVDRFRVGIDAPEDETNLPSYGDADELIENTGADIRFGGGRAFYSVADFIQMPYKHQFEHNAYYETIFHELTHWSEPRLEWDRAKHGYAMGELIAELSSVYVCSELGIPVSDSLGNHASYLRHWIEQMKGDSRFIFSATSQASKSADFLLAFRSQSAIAEEREPAIII